MTIAQQKYRKLFDAGMAGLIYDNRYIDPLTFIADTAIPFGRMLFRVPGADGKATLPTDSVLPKNALGVSMRTQVIENQAMFYPPDVPAYPALSPCNVLGKGRVYVYTEQAVVVGDPVFYRFSANAGVNEQQGLHLGKNVFGAYKLTGGPLGEEVTEELAFNADAATIKTALEAIVGVGNVDVTVYSGDHSVALVEWKGLYANAPQTLLEVTDNTTLVVADPQENWFNPSTVPASGTYKIDVNGEKTGVLNWNDSNATIQAALLLVPGVYAATVTGSWATHLAVNVSGPTTDLDITDSTLLDGTSTPVTMTVTTESTGDVTDTFLVEELTEGEYANDQIGVFRKDADDASGTPHAADANATGSGLRMKWFAGSDPNGFAVLEIE
jgi:hypothetical protein